MKRIRSIILCIIAISVTMTLSLALDYAPQEIIVKFKNVSSGLFSTAANSKVNIATIVSNLPFQVKENKRVFKSMDTQLQATSKQIRGLEKLQNIYQIVLNDNEDLQTSLAWLKSQDNVEYAHLNYIMYAVGTVPNDTSYLGAQKSIYDEYEMENAWDISTGSSSILVAVIDTGINYNHPDLAGKVLLGDNFTNPQSHDPMDDNGHGSHVAGIIAANSNNGLGITGMAWNVQLMAIKSLDSGGHGQMIYVVDGIEQAVVSGAHIINMSLSGSWTGSSGVMQDAINLAYANGIVIVAAAGNDNLELYSSDTSHMQSPVCNDGGSDINMVIGVASVGTSYAKSSFSNYSGEFVDISAIGENVYSTILGTSYQSMDGTSMAAPMVSGLAALILSASPNLITGTSATVEDVKSYIFSGASDIIDSVNPSYSGELGYGLINAYNSLYLLTNSTSNVGVPSTIQKFYNYPNPVSNSLAQTNATQFYILLAAEPASVRLSVYTYSGHRVLNKECSFSSILITGAGEKIPWNLKDDNDNVLPPGVYIAVLEVTDSLGGNYKDYHKVVIK